MTQDQTMPEAVRAPAQAVTEIPVVGSLLKTHEPAHTNGTDRE